MLLIINKTAPLFIFENRTSNKALLEDSLKKKVKTTFTNFFRIKGKNIV